MNNPLAQDLNHILEHTRGLWEEIRGERIFITGGTGFFGYWLLESFAWANDKLGLNARVVVLTRNYEAFYKKAPHLATNPAVKFHIGDVRNFIFPEGGFSHVINACGSGDGTWLSSPVNRFNTILEGTKRVLEFSIGCGVKKFLLTSSGSVYGKPPSHLITISEDYLGGHDIALAASKHGVDGISKRAVENLCAIYSNEYNIDLKIARCFSFVGPYLPLDIHYAIGNFIRDGLNGGPIKVKGDGKPYRSYLYSADLTIWLWNILIKGDSCRPYNVGSEEAYTIAELAHIVSDAFKSQPSVEIAKSSFTGNPPERYVPSVQRAVSELHLQQYIGIGDAIRKTVGWYSTDRFIS